jgi:hypothetical protein
MRETLWGPDKDGASGMERRSGPFGQLSLVVFVFVIFILDLFFYLSL